MPKKCAEPAGLRSCPANRSKHVQSVYDTHVKKRARIAHEFGCSVELGAQTVRRFENKQKKKGTTSLREVPRNMGGQVDLQSVPDSERRCP
jgi:hypothetical protein